MDDNVFHHDDGVVDDQANGGSQAAKGHQIEGLADDPEKEDCNRNGYGNHKTCNQRTGPIAQEEEEDDAGQH